MQKTTRQAPAGKPADPRIYAADGPAVTGATNMVSLPYLGTMRIRAYRDRNGIAWFVLTDIFKAMGAKYSATPRKNGKYTGDLDQVRAWIVNTVYPEASGYRFVASMSERGMHLLLGCRPYDAARALRQWMTYTAIPVLRTV